MSKTFTTVSNFILSLILPNKDEGLMGLLVGRFFGNIWEGICNIFYFICKWFLAFMDFLQYFIQKLVGLDYWLDSTLNSQRTLGGAMNDDMIFKFLYADSIQKVFRALCALFLILLIIFTIFAIVKSEWDYMVGDGSKGNSKAAVMRSMMKSIVLVAVFPILLIMGIVSSNAILASIIKAVGVDMAETFGGKIFSIAAKSANKHRYYVEANTYLPTSDKVDFYLNDDGSGGPAKLYLFGDMSTCDHSNCNTYHEHFTSYIDYFERTQRAQFKLSINSIFDPLVPVHLDEFSGFCFRVDDENGNFEYYFVQANSETKWTVYYYLTRVMDARVLAKGGAYASSTERAVSNSTENTLRKELSFTSDCDGAYISGFSMKKASATARTVCRNSWNYSLIYAKPGKSLSQSLASQSQPLVLYNLGSTGEGSILYNSHEISKYFDGGQFGVVQSRTEYAVMADVIDFMCDNNITFYIMDATSSQINWNHRYTLDKAGAAEVSYTVDTTWISNKLTSKISGSSDFFIDTAEKKIPEAYDASPSDSVATMIYDDTVVNANDVGVLTFLTSYSDTRTLAAEYEKDVIYTARFDVNDESKGSKYIICLKEEGKETFYPLVNGKKFGIGDKEYTFKSDHYSSDYTGVVWAKGAFDTSTVDGIYGNPTFLKGTSLTAIGDDEVVTDADGAYYYDISSDGKTLKLYNAYTRKLDFASLSDPSYLATYNNGTLYREGVNNLNLNTSELNTANWAGSKITLGLSNGGKGFTATYELTHKNEVNIYDAGPPATTKTYQVFASEDKGFGYVLFVDNNGNIYKPKNESGSMVPDSSSVYGGGNLEVCYIGEGSARVAGDLAIRTVTIADSSHDLFLGTGYNSVLKTKFSAFVVPSGATSEENGEYFGTFTKPLVNVIAGVNDLSAGTRILETYWGSKYYSIQTVGKCTGGFTAGLDLTAGIAGKFNDMIKFDIKSAVGMMMSYYESAQTASAVSCCRYQIENYSGNSFGSTLIEFNWELLKGIFELKFGTLQQVSTSANISHTFTYIGENSGITFDYFFDQNVELRTFYAASKIQYFVLLMSAIMIIKVLFNALWGVIKRFYMITLYYLAMPVAASTIPIDDGKRFSDVREKIIGEVLSTYGVLIGLNVFFVLLAPIREITSTIFTDAAIANSGSYFLKNLNIKADTLNELVYILFLLVAFTLIGELPSFVQGLVGKGQGIDATGAKMKGDVGSTLKSTGNVISGQAVIDTVKKGKEIVPGLLPGSALIGQLGKGFGELRKNFSEGYKKGRGGDEKEEKSNSRESEDNEFENQSSGGSGQGGLSQGGGNQGGGMKNSREAEGVEAESGNPLDEAGAEEVGGTSAGETGAAEAGAAEAGGSVLGVVGAVVVSGLKAAGNFVKNVGNAIGNVAHDVLNLGDSGYEEGEMAPGVDVENEGIDVENEATGGDANAEDNQDKTPEQLEKEKEIKDLSSKDRTLRFERLTLEYRQNDARRDISDLRNKKLKLTGTETEEKKAEIEEYNANIDKQIAAKNDKVLDYQKQIDDKDKEMNENSAEYRRKQDEYKEKYGDYVNTDIMVHAISPSSMGLNGGSIDNVIDKVKNGDVDLSNLAGQYNVDVEFIRRIVIDELQKLKGELSGADGKAGENAETEGAASVSEVVDLVTKTAFRREGYIDNETEQDDESVEDNQEETSEQLEKEKEIKKLSGKHSTLRFERFMLESRQNNARRDISDLRNKKLKLTGTETEEKKAEIEEYNANIDKQIAAKNDKVLDYQKQIKEKDSEINSVSMQIDEKQKDYENVYGERVNTDITVEAISPSSMGLNGRSIDNVIDKVKNGEVDLNNLAGQYNVDVELIRSIVIDELQKLKGELSGAGSEADAQDKADAQRQIQELDNANKVNENELDKETNAELSELEENSKLVVGDGEVSSEVEALDALNESDNDGRFAGLRKKFKESGLFSPLQAAKDKIHGIKDSKAVRVAKGLLGLDKDTTKGAFLGLAGKSLKAVGLLAIAATPALGGVVGAAVLAGGMFGVTKIGKKALEAGRKFKNADEATRAKIITKYGNMFLKSAAVATIGLATGGLGFAAIAGGGSMAALLVKDKKYRSAHPEANILANAKMKEPLVALSEENRERRQQIVQAAVGNMTDARRAQFAKDVSNANIKLDGKKVSVSVGAGGALQYTVGSGKNARVLDANNAQDAKEIKRIESRAYATLNENERKDAVRNLKLEEKADTVSSSVRVRQAAIVDRALQLNNGELTFGKNGDKVSYDSASKTYAINGVQVTDPAEIAKMKANVFANMSTEDKKKALTDIKRQEKTDEINAGKDAKKAEIAERAISGMSAEDLNKILATIHTFDSGAKDPVSSRVAHLTNLDKAYEIEYDKTSETTLKNERSRWVVEYFNNGLSEGQNQSNIVKNLGLKLNGTALTMNAEGDYFIGKKRVGNYTDTNNSDINKVNAAIFKHLDAETVQAETARQVNNAEKVEKASAVSFENGEFKVNGETATPEQMSKITAGIYEGLTNEQKTDALLEINKEGFDTIVSAIDEQRVRAISREEAEKLINQLDDDVVVNDAQIYRESEAELAELNLDAEGEADLYEVSSEVEALDALNESDNDGRFAGLRKKFKESGLFSPLQAAKDKIHGIKDSKAVRVAKGLLGLDKDTTKGAFLGLAGKSLKAVGLLAIAATPALGGVVGAAVLAGGMFGVTKIGKKALEAGRKFKNADEATRAKIITKYGNMFLKSAAVATIGLATGGLGFAAIAGGGSMAALLVKDKKYRSAHPEANILANAKMKEPLVALSEENRERRQQIVQAAVGNMTDARRAQFAKDVSNANIKLDGKKVSVNVGAGGALQYTVGSGKNARVLDANNAQDAKEIKRIESRMFSVLSTDEKRAVLANESRSMSAAERQAVKNDRKGSVAEKAVNMMNETRKNQFQTAFNAAGIQVNGNDVKFEQGEYKVTEGGKVRSATADELAKINLQVYSSNNLLSKEEKIKALAKLNKETLQQRNETSRTQQKDRIAQLALSTMSAEEVNSVLGSVNVNGAKVTLSNNGTYLVNGKTATDEQTAKINAEVYNNLTSAQKVNAVMSLRGKGDVDEARMIKVAEQVVARYLGGAQIGAAATNVDVGARDSYFSYSKEETDINQESNYDVNKQVNFTENGKYEVNGKKVTNRQAKAINNQIFDKLTKSELVDAIAKTNKVSSLQIANNAIYSMTDETRRDSLLKSVSLGDNKQVSVDDEGNYLVDGQKATKIEIAEINKQVYSKLTEDEKLDALYPMNNASRAEVARTAMKSLDETRKDAVLTDIDLQQINGLGEKKKKHPKLRAFLNAVFGYEKNTVKGATLGVAGKFVGLAGVAGAAGASIMLASPLGLLGVGLATGSFLAGKKVRDKFVITRARRQKMSEAERARYITKWGGNILKTTMGAALGLATGGIGFALAGGVATAGVLFAKNRKAKRASTKVHNSLSNSYRDTEVYETSSVSRPSYSVTGIQSAEQTKQMLVNDNSFVARLTQEVINSGRLLDDKEKMQVTRHYVNYGAIVDTTFVPDISFAYKNVVANSVGTRGGRSIVADAINNYASSNNMSFSQAIVEQGGLLSVESKVALYKSMMNEDQLNSYNLYMSRDEKKSALEQLNFIQNNVSGLGMTLGVGYDKNKGITFNVNGQEVKDLKGQKTEKTNSVNMALRQMLSSDKITNADIATSISNTNTSDYITKAVAQNYALTLDYSNEIINNTTENIYHQEVLERAKANADINAEAILKYLKNNTELFEQFRQEYGEANTKTNEDMLATIKMATDPRNVVPGSMFNNIRVNDYAKELSEVTALHVEDGSFKVQSFDLLPKALQMDVADRLVANLTAIYAGKAYGLTDNEKQVEMNLSQAQFGDSDLINTFLKSNIEDKDVITNKLVGNYYGFTDVNSLEAQKLLNEIGATKLSELKTKGVTQDDALIAYAKAKILGKANEFESFIGKNDQDVKVVETMMRGGKLEAKELKNFSDQEFVETVLQTAKDKNAVINQMVISSAGLITNSQGNIDVTSDRYLSLVEEMIDNKVWAKALEGKELESDETRNIVLGYAKAKVLGNTNSKDISAYVNGGNDEVNKNVISEFTKVSSSADIHALREIRYDYGMLSDAEVKEFAQALKYQEDLMNNLKTAFGYKEGGDAKTNSAAERAMRDFINSNGTKLDVLKYDGVKVNKTQFDKVRAEAFAFDENTGRTKAQDNAEIAERAKTVENLKDLVAYQNNKQTRFEVERQISAYEAIENLKKSYLTGQGNMSALNDAIQGNVKSSDIAQYLKQELSTEQIAKLVKDGSENGFVTLSVNEQNSVLSKLASQDKGAVKVLVNNNVDVKSLQAIAEFLNSGAGSALKERLISTVSSSLVTLNATRLGFDERQIFDLVRSVETRGSNAALYEMAQGDLISNRQVKEQLAYTAGSENTEQILQNAANKFELLTESEIEKIRQKVKEKPENKDLTETQLNSRVFWNILEAKMNMLSNGGLERQRKVSEVIWGNSTLRKLAQENFKNNKDINPNNAELENISEVDRNNFLFANYKNFTAKGSEERQIIENEINKHKTSYENKVDNKKAIESMSQSEFDSIIKEMNESGTKIVSNAKRQIIEKLNQDNRLTEIPDRAKMSKAEESEYDEMVSILQQRYRSGKSEEEFANLVRMSQPVNNGEIVRQILAGNNQSATSKEINAAKVETLKKNQEFENKAVVSVMSMPENAEILNKIIAKLKSEGIEYKKLSVVAKGESIKKLLGDETFTKTNKITSNQVDILNKAFGNKFIENTETATNYDIKMGMETKQITRLLSAHEKIRDRLIHLGAYNPHLLFGREKVYQAKTNYVLNYYHYRQIFMRTLMRELYTNTRLKKVIREEILNPNSKAYMPELKRLTNAEVNRFINANLDNLAARVGEAKLLDKNENGRFEFKPEFKERSFEYERAMRRVESENPTIKKKVKKAMSAAVKAMFGYTTEKDKEIDLMMETLAQKAESSSSFKNIVEKITKRSIPNAFEEFLTTGGGSQIINTQVDSRVDEKIKDVAYENHNRPIKQERASLLAELRKWQNKLPK